MRLLYHCYISCLLIGTCLGSLFEEVSIPNIDFASVGGEIGVYGDFDSLSFYKYINSTSYLSDSGDLTNDKLYLRDIENDYFLKIADTNGLVSQIVSLSNETFMAIGNFTQLNGDDVYAPIIYNITSGEVESLSSTSQELDLLDISNGSVRSLLRDENLVYLGGDFKFNNTVGAAIYDIEKKSLQNTKFKGFGEDSLVNTILKIFNNGEDEGSIIFGGKFNTLGISDLLVHNITTSGMKNDLNLTSNYSLITAEQMISLKSGIFSNVNGDGDESSIICPANDATWSVVEGEGGEWIVELPDEVKGITPSKARLYIPDDANTIKSFRIYSYPNNGIMNLSYIDPESNEIMYCSSSCPLLTVDDLKDKTSINSESDDTDPNSVIDEDGSYFVYYDSSTKSKVLGYGSNFQEFAFVNTVPMDKLGVTVINWYGSYGSMSGFELYLDSITVYGNNTLNEPNCDDDTHINYSEINEGNFSSILSLSPGLSGTNYLVSTDTDARISLYPNISYSGYYSIIMSTPGCIADNSCNYRSIVNVSVFGIDDQLLSSELIYQNNDYDKFDYLYYGHLNGSLLNEGLNKIVISFDQSIGDSDVNWVVVDSVKADIVSLDSYYSNSLEYSNKTSHHSNSTLDYIKLNGLFEYSLANFSSFDERSIYLKNGNKTVISKDSDFVGNSTLNVISAELGDKAEIGHILAANYSGIEYIFIQGNLSTKVANITLFEDSMMVMGVGSYNTSSNETEISLKDKDISNALDKVHFNNTIRKIESMKVSIIFMGDFQVTSNSSSIIYNLSNKNETISSANNFILLQDKSWYSFGNNFSDTKFDTFNNITINSTEYFIFTGDEEFWIWDNAKYEWINNYYGLNITEISELSSSTDVLSGPFVSVMDYYDVDQAYINSTNQFYSNDFSIQRKDSVISQAYYINDSLSIIGGKFNQSSFNNVAFIDATKSFRGLNGVSSWPNTSIVQALYAVEDEYVFIAANGSITIDNSEDITGISIYDLSADKFASFQPAALSSNKALEINAMAYYEASKLLLVGGNFDTAGSLSCPSLCIYDIEQTRWTTPSTNGSLSGTVSDIKFFSSQEVLISGNLTLNDENVNFVTYNFKNGNIGSDSSYNTIGQNKMVKKFIFTEENSKNVNGKMIAIGNDFISGYNESKWIDIGSSINYESSPEFNDIKILKLEDSNNGNNESLFASDSILVLAGSFELINYGLVSSALFNGTEWIPFLFSEQDNKIGEISTLLINDKLNFQSSSDLKSKVMSKGKVVGISLACALGSTSLLGLLFIIPYFLLFKRNNDNPMAEKQRIHENEMMSAVNPHDLLHEIDLQRVN